MSKREKFPNFKKRNGLIIAIIQDAKTKEVLMHAFMNPIAWHMTLKTGEFWRWSTEHNELQKKGATSNSVMKVKKIRRDCDGDAVVILVKVAGNGFACHFKKRSCFRPLMAKEKSIKPAKRRR